MLTHFRVPGLVTAPLYYGMMEQGGGLRVITWAVKEMMNYTLPAKEFSVFSQIAEK